MQVADNSTVHRFVSFNGDIVPAQGVQLSALSSAALYGRGVFTTVAIRNGTPFLWPKHLARLTADAARVGLVLGETLPAAELHLSRIIDHNRVAEGLARVTIFDGSPSPLWPADLATRPTTMIITKDARPTAEAFRVGLSEARVSSVSRLAGIKSCNYLDSLLAHEEVRNRGYHEAIRVNELGEIVSGCMSNTFWLKDGRLFTPRQETGCIPGTTREYILEELECEATAAGVQDLAAADALFFTSAGLGVVQAAEFSGRSFAPVQHLILKILNK